MNFCSDHESTRIYVCLVQEVSTCLGIAPAIQRDMVVSLEKEEQGGSHKLDVGVKELWLGLAWGAVALQILQGCIGCCSVLHCSLILQ